MVFQCFKELVCPFGSSNVFEFRLRSEICHLEKEIALCDLQKSDLLKNGPLRIQRDINDEGRDLDMKRVD